MKNFAAAVCVTLSIFSTAAFAEDLVPVASEETQILHFLTDVKTVKLGNFSARVITLNSFAEPEQSLYLLVSHDSDFIPEDANTALYTLPIEAGSGYSFQSLTKVTDNEIKVTLNKLNRTKVISISVNGLSASIK